MQKAMYTVDMSDETLRDQDVLGRALEVVEISEVKGVLASRATVFTDAERRYAASKSDPERRLAARLAAKRAMCRLLTSDVALHEVEVLPARGGPPRISLSRSAARRCAPKHYSRILLSLTHGRTHAAACVLLIRDRQ
jgi:phosphopantetheinyl transferase (holo-ACP synthase)